MYSLHPAINFNLSTFALIKNNFALINTRYVLFKFSLIYKLNAVKRLSTYCTFTENNTQLINNINNDAKCVYIKPGGMRDYTPQQIVIRDNVFRIIIDCFKRHCAQHIDTPFCESKHILIKNYGEDSKLIYDFPNNDGELLSIRYDLTVPFARYLVENNITNMTRYQIGKVCRRDQHSYAKGRYREFYQADFDIAGTYDRMVAEAECLRVVYEILMALKLNSFIIKVNHRNVLNSLLKLCGVPNDKFKTICSSIDKLDKNSWDEVKNEMCFVKGLDVTIADKIGEFVRLNGSIDFIERMLSDVILCENECYKQGLLDMKLLHHYSKLFKIDHIIRFDMSLARGLEYYTAIIYEVIVTDQNIQCGSIAAGGRYDDLVAKLSDHNSNVPCVGVSFGIERILTIIEENQMKDQTVCCTQCFVASIGRNMTEQRMILIDELWRNNIRAQHSYKKYIQLLSQLQYCEDNNIPFAIIIGEDEIKRNVVRIRNIRTRVDSDVPRRDFIEHLKKLLSIC